MKVKVLNYLNEDNGEVMDTFVFKSEADLSEIKSTVANVFEEECGERPYCAIITDLFGHLLLEEEEREDVYW